MIDALIEIGFLMATVKEPVVTDDLTGEVILQRDAVQFQMSRAGQVFTLDLSEENWLKLRETLPEAVLEAFQSQAAAVARKANRNLGGRPKGRSSLFASPEAKRAKAGEHRVVARENVSLSYYRKFITAAAGHGLLLEVEPTPNSKISYGRVLLSPL